jgi:hypothetical protein
VHEKRQGPSGESIYLVLPREPLGTFLERSHELPGLMQLLVQPLALRGLLVGKLDLCPQLGLQARELEGRGGDILSLRSSPSALALSSSSSSHRRQPFCSLLVGEFDLGPQLGLQARELHGRERGEGLMTTTPVNISFGIIIIITMIVIISSMGTITINDDDA